MNKLELDRSFASLSFAPERHWRLWRYKCTDLPLHTHPHWFLPGQECHFCVQVEKLIESLRKDNQPLVFESKERWPNYVNKDRLFENAEAVLNAVESEQCLPSKLAKSVFFNKKVGAAFFREAIPPNYKHPRNAGGNFQLLLLGNAGKAELLEKFDKIVLATFKMVAKEMDKPFLQAVNGIFIRCEINPGKNLTPSKEAYANLEALPCMFKLEVWIREQSQEEDVNQGLIEKINEQIQLMGLSKNDYRPFRYNSRNAQE